MYIRPALLAFAFASAAVPAMAQGPGAPPPNYPQLAQQVAALSAQVTTLQAKVAKLEGNITADDLAGSYTLTIMNTPMSGVGPGRPARISTDALMATVTLNADRSASFVGLTCGGARLILGSGAVIPDPDACPGGTPVGAHWAYAGGTLTLFFDQQESESFSFSLGAGGRFGIFALAPFHSQDPSSDQILAILSRLK